MLYGRSDDEAKHRKENGTLHFVSRDAATKKADEVLKKTEADLKTAGKDADEIEKEKYGAAIVKLQMLQGKLSDMMK